MTKAQIWGWVLIGALLLGGIWWAVSVPPAGEVVMTPPPPAAEQQNGNEDAGEQGAVIQDAVVRFTENGYEPATVTIKKGQVVLFQNDSEAEMWPASARHPTHNVYPTTGGCLGSTFDACRAINSGGAWSFTFEETGAWRYHDHLNAQFTGTVEVTE